MKKLNDAEISSRLAPLAGWSVQDGKLHRAYKFRGFEQAIDFMVAATPGIVKMDHHPEWANVYDRVTVDLSTHSAGGITQNDFDLATKIQQIAGS